MNSAQSDNTAKFLRLILFSFDTSLNVTKSYTQLKILPTYKISLTDLIDSHKHEIYYLWINNTQCCQQPCNFVQCNRGQALKKDQILKLYNLSLNSFPGHFKKKKNVVQQYCICRMTIFASCVVDKLDLTLLCTLIRNCCKITDDEKLWLNTIREIRNNLSHVESVSVFDPRRLKKWWDQLQGAVLDLTSKMSTCSEYEEVIKNQIDFLKLASFGFHHARSVLDRVKQDNTMVCKLFNYSIFF